MSEPVLSLPFIGMPKSAFNFRQVIPSFDTSNVTSLPGVLYRSSKLDNLPEEELDWFKKKGIKTIIDARSVNEYRNSRGSNHIDKFYDTRGVSLPFLRWRYGVGEKVKVNQVEIATTGGDIENTKRGDHFFIDFLRLNYFLSFFDLAPWYMVLYSIWILVKDIWNKNLFRTNFLYFYERRWPSKLARHYRNFVDRSQASFAAALKLLSRPGALPAVITCRYGKDRTGLLVAFILTLIGKSREFVIHEYTLTQEGMASQMDRLRREVCQQHHVSEDVISANEETIACTLEYIDTKYGGVEDYLEHCGFGKDEQEALRLNIMGKIKQS